MSLNLLLGTTGLVSFGHAAYFGIGAYTCGILMKTLGVPFWPRFPGGRRDRGGLRARVRLLLRAPHQDLLRDADPGLRADRLGDLLQVERRHGRRAGPARRALSRTSTGCGSLPGFRRLPDRRPVLPHRRWSWSPSAIAALRRLIDSPFGRMLTTIRENPERAEFIGVNVRAYELAAFVSPAASPGWPAGCSASSTAASSPTSCSGRSRPRC